MPAVPGPGEIVHAHEIWEEPGGGGAVAAVQLAKLAGGATFFTALGDDELGHRAKRELEAQGLRVDAAFRPEPQRRGFVHVDGAGERTITVIGDRLGPRADDPLPWDELSDTDAVYLTAGDAGAVRRARAAPRDGVHRPAALEALAEAGVELDALVASGADEGSATSRRARPAPRAVVRTAGAAGGPGRPRRRSGRYEAAPCPGRSATPTAAATASPPA